jgi:hypothetical protein
MKSVGVKSTDGCDRSLRSQLSGSTFNVTELQHALNFLAACDPVELPQAFGPNILSRQMRIGVLSALR